MTPKAGWIQAVNGYDKITKRSKAVQAVLRYRNRP